ncbi:MAG: glycosyltransferase, partial [Chloroflexi bacterium]|nr:glycosyltransferase [Chloroflexota bacterium]
SFASNACRPAFVADVLLEFGEVEIVTTDFDHQTKKRIEVQSGIQPYHVHFIPTLSYDSNISVRRFLSHIFFGIKAGWFYWRRRTSYDIVYATLPFNLATWFVLLASCGKARIVDIIDIWPDVLPFPPIVRHVLSPVFWLWKRLFVASVQNATVLLAVSNSFLDEARCYIIGKPTPCHMFYIGHAALPTSKVTQEEMLTISYVGNIGHLYDFETLIDVLSSEEFNERVQLFVIGGGDRKDWLLDELQRRGIRHQYFGIVYSPEDLGSILRRTHVGFNGYVNTSAAFSYKASTYLSASLPILSSMGGDLHHLVTSRGLGINYEGGNVESLCQALRECTPDNLKKMSKAAEAFAQAELEVHGLKRRMKEFLTQALQFTSAQ